MLAVDIGNTFTRLAAFAGGEIRGRRSFRTAGLDPAGLSGAFAELAALADAGGVYVASVVPDANAAVDSAAGRLGLARRFIRSGRDAILPHALTTPETTGVDRLLSALAAGERHFGGGEKKNGYVVVQCGTAATVDFVDGAGVFGGGYILPGPTLWLRALGEAAQLPDLSSEAADWDEVAAGKNTRDALRNGMHLSLPAAVAAAANLIGEGTELPVALTGGWCDAVACHLRRRHEIDRDLLLHGICIFAERNGRGRE